MNEPDPPLADNPFPGLRPFGADEGGLFFGRERQSDELLRRLARQRLLAVVGTSGSGKSSLVHAGLVPALESGYLAAAGSRWRIVALRPQSDPIGSLAAALQGGGALAAMDLPAKSALGIIDTTLRRSSRGLIDAARLLDLAGGENLLVFVDQFEELFRYAALANDRGSGDDATAFVQLLLQAVQQQDSPLYVVLTMRSDFLGDCARFRGLPEAISEGQYLIPRLSRDELHLAITGPLAVRGGTIDAAVVQRLLNEVGDDPDQLPLLQHLLMRAWDYSARRSAPRVAITLDDLVAIGGLSEALSLHADEAWSEDLDEAGRTLAARLFRCVTERTEGGREVRRPTALGKLQAITEASTEELHRVIKVFRAPGRNFLMPPAGTPLTPHTEIDISHESLMRQWKRLREWVQAEWEARTMLLRLVQAEDLYRREEAGLWGEPELGHARRWVERERPVPAWADRYVPGLASALAFVEESQADSQRRVALDEAKAEAERQTAERELAQTRELARLESERAEEQHRQLLEQRQRQRRLRQIFTVVGVVLSATAGFALWSRSLALRSEATAQEDRRRAVAAQKTAVQAETQAQTVNLKLQQALLEVDEKRLLALQRQAEAEKARREAQTALAQAKVDRSRADEQARIAEDRLERMKSIIARVPDPVLRNQLQVDYFPGATRELTTAQQRTLEAKAAAAGAEQAGPRVPQPAGYKLWRNGSTLRVRFMGGSSEGHAVAKAAAEEWSRAANLRFQFVERGESEIRIAFRPSDGSWAFMGIDALGVAPDQPTMNLGFLGDIGSALHEFGHVLGLIHETANPNANLPWNRDAVLRTMIGPPNFWGREQVEQNFFRKDSLASYRAFDPKSVMMYGFPASYFTDGVARGEVSPKALSESDIAFAARLYPRP